MAPNAQGADATALPEQLPSEQKLPETDVHKSLNHDIKKIRLEGSSQPMEEQGRYKTPLYSI